jgi:hypothetical protein
MTGLQSLAARTALGAVAAAATLALPACRRFYLGAATTFDRALLIAFAAGRLLLFALVFLVLRIAPRGDVIGYYVTEARAWLAGQRPYIDFNSSYAPLHPYMDAGLLLLHNSPLTLVLFAILAECLTLWLWLRVARTAWPDPIVRTAALLYFASPLSLQFVTIDGQDNVLIAMLLGLAILFTLRLRPVISGLLLALSICALKFLPLIYVPAFWLTMKRRWLFTLGCFIGVVPLYATFGLRHYRIAAPLLEGKLKSAGGVPFVMETLTGVSWYRPWDLLLICTLGCVVALVAQSVWRRRSTLAAVSVDTPLLVAALAATTLVLLLMAKKTWPPYIMMVLFPICLLVALHPTPWRRAALAAFSLVAVVEHSLFDTVMGEINAFNLSRLLAAHNALAWVFLAVEFLLLAGYAWLLSLAVSSIRRPPPVSA